MENGINYASKTSEARAKEIQKKGVKERSQHKKSRVGWEKER